MVGHWTCNLEVLCSCVAGGGGGEGVGKKGFDELGEHKRKTKIQNSDLQRSAFLWQSVMSVMCQIQEKI